MLPDPTWMTCTLLHTDSVAMLRGCWCHVRCYAWQRGRTRNRVFWSTSKQITNLLLTWIPSPWNHQEWGVLMFVENSRYIWTSVHLCQWNSAVWDCPKQWVLYHQTVFRFCDKKKKEGRVKTIRSINCLATKTPSFGLCHWEKLPRAADCANHPLGREGAEMCWSLLTRKLRIVSVLFPVCYL